MPPSRPDHATLDTPPSPRRHRHTAIASPLSRHRLPPPSPRRHHHAALPSSPRRPPAIVTPSSRPRHAAIATPPSPYRPHHGCRRKPAPQPRPPPPVRRARGGVLGWMRLMDGSAPQYTLRHLSIWSLNLYPGRNFSIAANRQAALSRASPSLPCLCDPCNACLWSCDVRWSGRCAHATRRRRCADVIREDACMPRMYHRVCGCMCVNTISVLCTHH